MTIRRSHAAAALLWALLALLGWTAPAAAQGVTTSAVAGRVTTEQGEPIEGAAVVATNTRTGAEYRAVTRGDGRFLLQGLQPGGPYRVQASRVGLGTQSRAGVQLALSQTETVDFTLAPQAVVLEAISVTAEDRGAVISPGRTGTAMVISDSAISRLPTITRDFTDFTRLVPQISTSGSGTSGAGRNFRFNSIQIDGAANNDLFGLASSGTPGGQAGTKPITLEAIQEFQVVLAPFDVRQGGFTGAGINAVTRSGTNDLEGSVAFFGRNESLVGNYEFDRAGTTVRSTNFREFKQNELAFSVGGPIIRDRAFFFVAGEMARREAPNGTFVTRSGTGFTTTGSATISGARVDSVATILREVYGYDPGTYEELNLRRESDNLFARFDVNLGANNRLTLRHNYVDAFDDNFSRSDASFYLGNGGYVFNSTTNATVGQLNSTFANQLFNEFRVGYTTVRDNREVPSNLFPRVEVDLPSGSCAGSSCRVVAGSENFSVANALDQDVLEITNDLSFSRGIHSVTVGTTNQFFSFSNLFARNLYGFYRFSGVEALRAGTPSRYEFSFFNEDVEGAQRRAEFSVRQLSFYVQDRMSLSSRLTLTAGLRWDLTQFPDNPGRNPAFETAFQAAYTAANLGTFGRRTDQVPENTVLFNPRVGFNFDVTGNQSTQVRGGVGLFSGRTPYVWVSNAYGNTGLDYTRFTCASSTARAPRFNPNPANQPRACVNAAGESLPVSALANEINTIDPDFKLPQVLRYSLAVDQRLPFGLYGTLEGLYTDSRSDPTYRDLTVIPAGNTMVEGRQAYTRVRASGFGSVYDVFNTGENFSYSLTAQLQRPFIDGWEASLAYTFSRSEDVNGLTSSQASSNFRFNPIDQNPNAPALRTALNDVPHRIVASGTRQFTFFRRAPTDLSLIYVGESGRPYSYTYNGDVNGDGQDANDLIYVPASADQVRFAPQSGSNPYTPEASWQNLNAFIESVECLREARGTVIERNACRQPWSNRFDVRFAQTLPTLRGQGAQFTIDILNFANLLNSEWGVSEFVPNQADQVLRVSSTTAVDGRVLLNGFAPRSTPFTISDLGSRYQVQAGIRYAF
ncbi:MAG: carboxypeptidase regulatory-like domain-containing protein [Gemmatimonadetes bacterium]|nr:carboxypeptidase regulatory-like domain-containing protein [Gemmatimonadota bacterium]